MSKQGKSSSFRDWSAPKKEAVSTPVAKDAVVETEQKQDVKKAPELDEQGREACRVTTTLLHGGLAYYEGQTIMFEPDEAVRRRERGEIE